MVIRGATQYRCFKQAVEIANAIMPTALAMKPHTTRKVGYTLPLYTTVNSRLKGGAFDINHATTK